MQGELTTSTSETNINADYVTVLHPTRYFDVPMLYDLRRVLRVVQIDSSRDLTKVVFEWWYVKWQNIVM